MSKLKLRLAGLAFIGLGLLSLGGRPASATDCIDVICYGTNPDTGECYQFSNPCSVPQGWTINYQGCAS
jgi:hypothetical protein